MGTSSYVLVGTEQGMKASFGSACHGAGRSMSRNQARKRWRGRQVVDKSRLPGLQQFAQATRPGIGERRQEPGRGVAGRGAALVRVDPDGQAAGAGGEMLRGEPLGLQRELHGLGNRWFVFDDEYADSAQGMPDLSPLLRPVDYVTPCPWWQSGNGL